VIGWGVSILWGVENCPFPLTKPVAVNTGLALPRSLWSACSYEQTPCTMTTAKWLLFDSKRLHPNILRRVLAVFTRSAITRPNRYGWNLEDSEYVVGDSPDSFGSAITLLYHRSTILSQTGISHGLKISYSSEHNGKSHNIRTTVHAVIENLPCMSHWKWSEQSRSSVNTESVNTEQSVLIKRVFSGVVWPLSQA